MDKFTEIYNKHAIQEIYTKRFYELGWFRKDIWDVIKWKPYEDREYSLDDVFDYCEGMKDLLDILKLNRGKKDNANKRKI